MLPSHQIVRRDSTSSHSTDGSFSETESIQFSDEATDCEFDTAERENCEGCRSETKSEQFSEDGFEWDGCVSPQDTEEQATSGQCCSESGIPDSADSIHSGLEATSDDMEYSGVESVISCTASGTTASAREVDSCMFSGAIRVATSQRASRMATAQQMDNELRAQHVRNAEDHLRSLTAGSKQLRITSVPTGAESTRDGKVQQKRMRSKQTPGRHVAWRGKMCAMERCGVDEKKQRRTDTRLLLLRMRTRYGTSEWFCPGIWEHKMELPLMHNAAIVHCMQANAPSQGRLDIDGKGGAALQLTQHRMPTHLTARAAAGNTARVEWSTAIAKRLLRSKGVRVLCPLASNGFAMTGALNTTHDTENDEYVQTAGNVGTLYNAMPITFGASNVMDAARKIAKSELEHCSVSDEFGRSSVHLTNICRSVVAEECAPHDRYWASIALLSYVAHSARGLKNILAHSSLSAFHLYASLFVEWYGQAEVTRYRNQRVKKQKQASRKVSTAPGTEADHCELSSLQAEITPEMTSGMSPGPVPDSITGLSLTASSSTLSRSMSRNVDSVSSIAAWDEILTNAELAQVVGTLLSDCQLTSEMAAIQTLSRQAPDQRVSSAVRSIAEQHAVATSGLMQQVLCPDVPHTPVLMRFDVTVCEQQLAVAGPGATTRHDGLAVVRGAGFEKVPDEAAQTAIYVVQRPVPGRSVGAPPRDARTAFGWVVATQPLRSRSSDDILPCQTEGSALLHSRALLGAKRGVFGVGHGEKARVDAAISRRVDVANTDTAHAPMPCVAIGLSRSFLVQQYRMCVSMDDPHARRIVAQYETDAAKDAVASVAIESEHAQSMRGGRCAHLIGCQRRGDTGMPEPLPMRGPLGLHISMSEKLRTLLLYQARQRNGRPVRTSVGVDMGGLAEKTTPGTIDAYDPLPFAPTTSIEVDIMSDPDPATGECDVVVSKQIVLAHATRLVDIVADVLDRRDGVRPRTAGSPREVVDLGVEGHGLSEHGPLHTQSTLVQEMTALVYAGASHASLIADTAHSIGAEAMTHSVTKSERVRNPDISFVGMHTWYDALFGTLQGLQPMCIDTHWEGTYSSYCPGRIPPGQAASNNIADERHHGRSALGQGVAEQCTDAFMKARFLAVDGEIMETPAETHGEPHGLMPGVHACLDPLWNSMQMVHFDVMNLTTASGKGVIRVPATVELSQQLDVDCDPACVAASPYARLARDDATEAIANNSIPMSDGTHPDDALLRSPGFCTPQKSFWSCNPLCSALPYGEVFFQAASVLAGLARLVAGTAASPQRAVQVLHTCMHQWHTLPTTPWLRQEHTDSAKLLPARYEWTYATHALVILHVMFPCTHGIAERVVPLPYAYAVAECTKASHTTSEIPTLAECFSARPVPEQLSLRAEATSRWSSFSGERGGRCAWAQISPLVVDLLRRSGRPTDGRTDIAKLRVLLERAVAAAALVYSQDGHTPPEPPHPLADLVWKDETTRLHRKHMEPVFHDRDDGTEARRCVVGVHAFQFRQVLALLMGAHVVDEVNCYGQEGQMLYRISSDACILRADGSSRTNKATSPLQADRDSDQFGTREQRVRVCARQGEAFTRNWELLMPLYLQVTPPKMSVLREMGAVGRTEAVREDIRACTESHGIVPHYSERASDLFGSAACTRAAAESIEALHARAR